MTPSIFLSHLASAVKVSSLRQKETFYFSFCVSLLSAVNSTGLVSLEIKSSHSLTALVLYSGSAVCFSSVSCCWAVGVLGEVVSWTGDEV